MNILGRIAYYFSVFINWFVECWQWLANMLASNPLLREIMRVLGYAIIGFMIFYLIKLLINKISA